MTTPDLDATAALIAVEVMRMAPDQPVHLDSEVDGWWFSRDPERTEDHARQHLGIVMARAWLTLHEATP